MTAATHKHLLTKEQAISGVGEERDKSYWNRGLNETHGLICFSSFHVHHCFLNPNSISIDALWTEFALNFSSLLSMTCTYSRRIKIEGKQRVERQKQKCKITPRNNYSFMVITNAGLPLNKLDVPFPCTHQPHPHPPSLSECHTNYHGERECKSS